MPKRLVIFVEGKGDVGAVPALAQRVVNWLSAYDALYVDYVPFRVRGVGTLVRNNCADWHRWLTAAGRTRQNIGGILLVLDGDLDRVSPQWARYLGHFGSSDFCAYHTAAMLGEEARSARAGDQYSLATVFAVKEFEAWLVAGLESLRGKPLAAGRGKVPNSAVCPATNVEATRDPKGYLREAVPAYEQSLDQGPLANEVDLEVVHKRCRSFRRFCTAIEQLAAAVRSGQHVVTPALPAPKAVPRN